MKIQETKNSENEPSNLDDSPETIKNNHFEKEFEEQSKKKVIVKRSLISTPYSTPKFVFKRINDFVMQVLGNRCSKPLEEVSNDFHELEPYSTAFLALEAVDQFEIQLVDMDIIIDLIENFDKSAEDMSPPITETLEPLNCIEVTMVLRLKPTASSTANSLINIFKALDLKVVKLQVVGPGGSEQNKGEEKL